MLERRLGSGAMGEVWLATDTLLDRPVAIKYMKATDDARIKKLFLAEARTLAKLNHPNITQVYEAVFDEQPSRFYIVMEYVKGEPLSDIIHNWSGPLPLEIVLDVTIGIVKALDYAHQKGIVHRDIKPANVIIQTDGIQLIDFGIAGLISLLEKGTNSIVGTPAYISPEQIEGLPLDGRADLYSLGIMLFEMTSGGDRPFAYPSQTKLFEAHLEEEPPNLKEYAPDIPFALERTIMRLLAKSPEDRYPSAAALLEILQAIKARQKFSQPYLQLLEPEARPLVGRTAELEQLKTIWRDTQASARPRLLVVQGGMGRGKTRLITDFLGHEVVDKGLIALAGRCAETGVPYGPFAEILGTIFNGNLTKTAPSQTQIDELLEQIPGLTRILNITPTKTPTRISSKSPKKPPTASGLWQALTQRVPESAARDFSETQWQFSKTILDILSSLGPTVLFLEDATYLDEASLALIRFLVRQEPPLPLLLIAACREANETPAWLNTFAPHEITTLTLSPLSTPAIKEYVTSLIDGVVANEVVALIEERSQGIPLTIEELTRQLVESAELVQDKEGVWQRSQKEQLADAFLPQSVLGAFQRRIEQLTASSREALTLAALIEPGPEFERTLWATLLLSELPDQSPQQILDEAIKKRLLRPLREGHYAFRPPDVAKALRATLTGTRRQALHQQIASILAEAEADPLLVAYHHEQAGSVTEAARYLELAGAKAMTANALNAAVTYYSRAAALGQSRTAYTAMGHLYRQQGQHAEAVKAYQHTLFLAKKAGDVKDEGRILNSLSLTLCLSDQYEAARQHAAEVLELESASEITRAIAQSHLGMILWLTGQLLEAEDWCRKAISVLDQSDNQADLAETYYRLGLIYTSQGKFNKARLALQQALKLRRDLKDETGEAHCLNSMGRVVSEQGDFEQATSLFTSAQKRFDKLGARDGLVVVYLNQGRALGYQKEPDRAISFLRKAFQVAKDIGEHSAYILGDIYLLIAQGSLLQDKIDLAKSAADDGLRLVEGTGNREHIAQAKVTLAQIYTRQNDLAAAEVMYKEALTLFEKVGCRPGLVRAKLNYAQFLLKNLGQTTEAVPLQREARHEAKQMELYLPT